MKLNIGKKDAAGSAGGKKTGGAAAFLSENKKHLITTAIVLVVAFLVTNLAKFGAGIFRDMQYQTEQAVIGVTNEMDNLRKSDRYFTQDVERQDFSKIQVEWLPANGRDPKKAVVDTGRWMADENIFWEFIYPAFSFDSATEYNQMREDYIEKVGNCLFTVQFMSYYDIESKCRKNENGTVNQVDFERVNGAYKCTTDKSKYRTYPTSIDVNGDYTYVALVPMQGTYVAFTYKIVHSVGQGGSERITLSDFDCWPPNSGARMGTG